MLTALWSKDHIRQKFTEFEQIAKARSASRELLYIILFGRIVSLFLNVILAILGTDMKRQTSLDITLRVNL